MANEIYDSTWWGVTIDTASSIGTSTEMIQGQFNLTKLGDELVTNGSFDTDSDWNLGTGWTIDDGKAVATNSPNSERLQQNNVLVVGKTYKVTYEITEISQGGFRGYVGGTNLTTRSTVGIYTETLVAPLNDVLYIRTIGTTTGSIDNVSVKEVRATTVEAKKCLADWIHTTALKDLNN